MASITLPCGINGALLSLWLDDVALRAYIYGVELQRQ